MTTTTLPMNGTQYDMLRSAVTYHGGMINSYGDRRTLKALANRGWVIESKESINPHGFNLMITRDGATAAMEYIMTGIGANDCEMIRFVIALTKVSYYAEMYGKIV